MLDVVYDAGKIIGLEIYIRIAFGNLILEYWKFLNWKGKATQYTCVNIENEISRGVKFKWVCGWIYMKNGSRVHLSYLKLENR